MCTFPCCSAGHFQKVVLLHNCVLFWLDLLPEQFELAAHLSTLLVTSQQPAVCPRWARTVGDICEEEEELSKFHWGGRKVLFLLNQNKLKDVSEVSIKRNIVCGWYGMTPSHRELQKHDGDPFCEVDLAHLSHLPGLLCAGGKERYVGGSFFTTFS